MNAFATQKQLDLLDELGIRYNGDITKSEATMLITEFLDDGAHPFDLD